MSSQTAFRELLTRLPARPVPLFPDDVVRIIESGTASDLQITSFEIQAVIRGLRQPERWKQRDDHYDSVCWWMGQREFQCQWYPDGNYLVFTERAFHTACDCGWEDDEIVIFSHVPEGRSLSDLVAREEGSVPVHQAVSIEAGNSHAVDTHAATQHKLSLESDGTLGGSVRKITRLVVWWLLEFFEISDERTPLFEPEQLYAFLGR